MQISQTTEDQKINRRIAKRLGTWGWMDKSLTTQQNIREYALSMTGARVGFASAAKILCKGE